MFSCLYLITSFCLKLCNWESLLWNIKRHATSWVTYVAYACFKKLFSNIISYLFIMLFAFKQWSCMSEFCVFTLFQNLFLLFDKALSTKISQIFNKWDKPIIVKTQTETSAFSSFILCIPHQSYNFLCFRAADRFSSL